MKREKCNFEDVGPYLQKKYIYVYTYQCNTKQ